MKRIEYRTIDKSKWPRGAWDNEPDKVQWPDEATGLPCLAVRHWQLGHWCGYVGIAPGHPLYDKKVEEEDLSVHGGITFSGHCSLQDEATSVCHKPAAGEPDDVFWIGFECAHVWDLTPGLRAISPPSPWAKDDEYRTLAYVQNECANLAQQLKTARKPRPAVR